MSTRTNNREPRIWLSYIVNYMVNQRGEKQMTQENKMAIVNTRYHESKLRAMSITHANEIGKVRKTWLNIKNDELLLIKEMLNDGSTMNNRVMKYINELELKLNKVLEVNNA
jgi:hypothetical protein